MSPLLLAALLATAPFARAGVGRAVEAALPGELGSFKPVAAPPITLQLPAITGLAPSLSPALAAPLAPALRTPAPLASPVTAVAADAGPSPGTPYPEEK